MTRAELHRHADEEAVDAVLALEIGGARSLFLLGVDHYIKPSGDEG